MFRSLLYLFISALSLTQTPTNSPQSKGQTTSPQNSVTFRSASRLVNVDVVVTGREGRPVKGLTKGNFQVFDKGQFEKIAIFTAPENWETAEVARPLSPGEYSNDAHRTGRANQGATIILFDALNSGYLTQAYAMGKIRILLRQLEPDDHVGIYVLHEEGLKVVYEPSQPASVLLEAMQRYDAAHAHRAATKNVAEERSTGLKELDRFLQGKEDRQPPRRCDPETLAITVAAFQEIARSTSGLGGRKSIIWVSEHALSFYNSENAFDPIRQPGCGLEEDTDLVLEDSASLPPLTRSSSPRSNGVSPTSTTSGRVVEVPGRDLSENDELDILLRLLTKNNIILYPVSAEGLQAVRLFGPGLRGGGIGINAWPDRPEQPSVEKFTRGAIKDVDEVANVESHQEMAELAQRSGGRAFYNRNDLETGIRRALDDSKYHYELAYYPDHDKWNGAWHKIQVKVNRPGVTVLARGGYYAFPVAKLLPPKARKQMIEEIVASLLDDTEIPITVKMTPPSGGEYSPTLQAKVILSAQKLFTNEMESGWKSDFEVLFFQLTSKNIILDVTTQNVNTQLTPEKYADAVKKGINTLQPLQLKPGASLLSVVVHDKRTDAVGSVRIPLGQYAATLQPVETRH